MSYLVDALKKAERERYARQAQDIHALSANAASGASAARGSAWLWLVAILVASNLVLAIYIWRPRPADPAPDPVTTQYRSLPTANTLARAVPEPDNPKAPSRGDATTTPSTADRIPAAAQHAPRARQAPGAGAEGRTPADTKQPTRGDKTSAHGRVTYAKVPLSPGNNDSVRPSDRNGNPQDAPNTPDQSELSNVPSVNINGQLYSTVPGRSFILVDGRRYHEGERLASGPAVESIQPNGATLRYHGQRYHVAGPG